MNLILALCCEPEPFREPLRCHVLGMDDADDPAQGDFSSSEPEYRLCSLVRVPVAPVLLREPPPDLGLPCGLPYGKATVAENASVLATHDDEHVEPTLSLKPNPSLECKTELVHGPRPAVTDVTHRVGIAEHLQQRLRILHAGGTERQALGCRFFAFALTVDGRGAALEIRGPAEGLALFGPG